MEDSIAWVWCLCVLKCAWVWTYTFLIIYLDFLWNTHQLASRQWSHAFIYIHVYTAMHVHAHTYTHTHIHTQRRTRRSTSTCAKHCRFLEHIQTLRSPDDDHQISGTTSYHDWASPPTSASVTWHPVKAFWPISDQHASSAVNQAANCCHHRQQLCTLNLVHAELYGVFRLVQ